jgi:Na+/H+ antiporter NhaD/arsenite permease-like protein
MGPTVVVAFSVSLVLFKLFFRKESKAAVSNLEQTMAQDESKSLKDKKRLKNHSLFS